MRGQQPYAGGERAALVVNVDAKAPDGVADETEVDGAVALQLFVLPRIEQGKNEGADVLGGERGAGGRGEGAVDAQGNGIAGDEQQVRSIVARGRGKQLIERGGILRRALGGWFVGIAGDGPVQLRDDACEFVIVFSHRLIVHSNFIAHTTHQRHHRGR